MSYILPSHRRPWISIVLEVIDLSAWLCKISVCLSILIYYVHLAVIRPFLIDSPDVVPTIAMKNFKSTHDKRKLRRRRRKFNCFVQVIAIRTHLFIVYDFQFNVNCIICYFNDGYCMLSNNDISISANELSMMCDTLILGV